ncbi:MAG TPA: tripartite tricarboxylate transporter substrate binding protein [Casimicrobiaceae bacterium]|nr:tripartite tricarboxylate transporter substrate binding protein [Casimicrobiaceae bacterium]
MLAKHLLASLAAVASITAYAQSYPQKPIHAIVPYGVGQATDVMCRVFLERVRSALNQTVVIENRPGAGGNIGAAEAARAAPDGYTVLCTGNATHISNPFVYENMGLDPEKDLQPVSAVAGTGYVLLVNNKYKGKSLADIIAMAKAAPKPLTMGAASTTAQVLYAMFTDAAKIQLVRVPYAAGNATLFTDLMRGDVDLVIEAMPSAMAPINNGQVTAIAVTNPVRTPFLPDVPTFKESGVDLTLVGWNAFYVPKGTPVEVVATLNRAANEALKDPDVKKRFATVASEPIGGTPNELQAMIKADRGLFEPRIKALGLKAQ